MEVPFFVFTGPITPEELEIRRTLGLDKNPHKFLTEDDMMKCVFLENKVDHLTDVPLDKNTGLSKSLNITKTERRRSNQNLSINSKYSSTIENIVKSRNSHSFYSSKNVQSTPNSFLQDFNLTYDSTQQKSPNVTVRGESVSNVESFIEGFDTFQEVSHKPIKSKKETLLKKLMNKKYKYSKNSISNDKSRSSKIKSNSQIFLENITAVEESEIDLTGDISEQEKSHNESISIKSRGETSHQKFQKSKDFVDMSLDNKEKSSILLKSLQSQSMNEEPSQEEFDINFGNLLKQQKILIQNKSLSKSIKDDEGSLINGSGYTKSMSERDKTVDLTAKKHDATVESIPKSSISRKSMRANAGGNLTQGLNIEDLSQLEDVNLTLGDISSMEKNSIQRKSTQKKKNSLIKPNETSVYNELNSTLLQSSRRSTRDKSNVDLTAKNLSKVEESEVDETFESVGKSSIRRKSKRASAGDNVTQGLNFEDMSQLEESHVNFTLGHISSMEKNSIQRKSTQKKENSLIKPNKTSVYNELNSTLLQRSRRSTRDKSNVDLTAKNLSKVEESEIDETFENIGKTSIGRKSLRASAGDNVTQHLNFEDMSQLEESHVNSTLGDMSSMEKNSIQRKSTQKKENSLIKPNETSVYNELNSTLLQRSRRSTRDKSNVDLTAKNLSKVEESEVDETFESAGKTSIRRKSLRASAGDNVTQGLNIEDLSQLEDVNLTLGDISSMEKNSIQRKSTQKKENSLIKPNETSVYNELNSMLLQRSRRSTRDKSNVDLTAKNLSKVEESEVDETFESVGKSSIRRKSLRASAGDNVTQGLNIEDLSQLEDVNLTLGDISSMEKNSIQRKSTQKKENSLSKPNETSVYNELNSTLLQSSRRSTRDKSNVDLTAKNLSKVEESEVDETFENVGKSSIRRKSLRAGAGVNVTQGLNFEDMSQLEESHVNSTLGDISSMEESSIQRKSTQNKKNNLIKPNETSVYNELNSTLLQRSRRSTRDKSNVDLTAKNLSKVKESEFDETFESVGKSSIRRKSLRASAGDNVTQGLNIEDLSQLEDVNLTLGDISSMEKNSIQTKSTQKKENSLIKHNETSVYNELNSTLLQSSRRSTRDKSNVDLTAKNLSKVEESEVDETFESVGKSSIRRKSLRASAGDNVTQGLNFEDMSQLEESHVNSTLGDISSMEESSIQRKSTQNKKNSLIKHNEQSGYEQCNSSLLQSSRRSARDESNVDLTAKNLLKVEESDIDETIESIGKSSIRRKSLRNAESNVTKSIKLEDMSQLEESHVNFALGDISSMEKCSIQRKSTQIKENSLIKPNETSCYDEQNSALLQSSRSTRDKSNVGLTLTAKNLSKVEESEIDVTFQSTGKSSIRLKSMRASAGSNVTQDLNFEDQSQLEDVNLTLVDISMEMSSIQRNSTQNKENNLRKSTRGKEKSLNAESVHNATPKGKTSQIRFLNVDGSLKVKESDIDSTIENESNMVKSLRKSTRRMERSLNEESEHNATPKRKTSQIRYLNVDEPSKVKESDIDSTVENEPNIVKSLRKSTRDLERSLNAESEQNATPKQKISQISYMNFDEPTKVEDSHINLTLGDLEKSSIIGQKSDFNTELFVKETPSLEESRVENISIRKKRLRKSSQPICELSGLEKSSSLQLSTSAKSDLFLMAENQSKVKESDIDSTLENEHIMGKSLRKSTRGKENSLNGSDLYFTPKQKISQFNEEQKLQNLAKSSIKNSPLLEIPRRSTRGSDLFLMRENQTRVEKSDIEFTLVNEVKLEKSLLKSSQGNESCYIDLNFTPYVQKSLRSAMSEKDSKTENLSNVEKSDINKLNMEENKNSQSDLSCLIDFNTPKIETNGQKYKKSLQKSARRSTRAETILELAVEKSEISSGIISKLRTPKRKISNESFVEDSSQYFTHGETSNQRKSSRKSSHPMERNFTPVNGISDESTPLNRKERFGFKNDNKSLLSPNTSKCLKRKSKFDESLIYKKSCISTLAKNNFLTPSSAIPIKQTSSQSKIPIVKKSQGSTLNTTPNVDLSKSESRIPKIRPPCVYSSNFFFNKK